MTIGDVLAAIALVALFAASWVGMLVFVVLIAPGLTGRAQSAVVSAPARCGLIGLVAAMVIVVPSLSGLSTLVGGHKLIPAVALGLLASVAFVGSTGIVKLIASRFPSQQPQPAGLVKAASIYFLASVFPVAGWFVVTPIALFVSIGAGISALFGGVRLSENQGRPTVSVDMVSEVR